MSWTSEMALQGRTVFVFDLGAVAAPDRRTAEAQAVAWRMHDKQTSPTTWEDVIGRELADLQADSKSALSKLGLTRPSRELMRGNER